MSTQHTPGRMKHAVLMGSITVGFRDEAIFHCGLGLRHHSVVAEQEQNARRLVACWNACLDVPTELLENYPAPFSRLREERDELLSMLRTFVEPQYVGGIDNDAALIRKAQDVIAKITGSTL